jgi:hypothetical protein
VLLIHRVLPSQAFPDEGGCKPRHGDSASLGLSVEQGDQVTIQPRGVVSSSSHLRLRDGAKGAS